MVTKHCHHLFGYWFYICIPKRVNCTVWSGQGLLKASIHADVGLLMPSLPPRFISLFVRSNYFSHLNRKSSL